MRLPVFNHGLAAVALIGLVSSTGCCRQGFLVDCSLELNRVPWRTGGERPGYGSSCNACSSPAAEVPAADCAENCQSCRGKVCQRPKVASRACQPQAAADQVPVVPPPGRFHPVPLKPVFGAILQTSGVAPEPEALSQPEPEMLPPGQPAQSDGDEANGAQHRMRLELGSTARPRAERGSLLAQHGYQKPRLGSKL